MSKSISLARLTRPPIYSHVHYLQHSGSVSELCMGSSGLNLLDPSHPTAKTSLKQFPSAKNQYFRLRAFPNALLSKPETAGPPTRPNIDLWAERVARATVSRKNLTLEQIDTKSYSASELSHQLLEFVTPPVLTSHPEGSIPMSLYFSIGKARTHKHAVIRRRLRTKFKAAINLVVTRGAGVEETSTDAQELTLNADGVRQRGDKWILPDWAYLCIPNPEMYLAPYPEIIRAVRDSLQPIWDVGMRLEASWAEAEMRAKMGLPPRAEPKRKRVPYSPKGRTNIVERKPMLHS